MLKKTILFSSVAMLLLSCSPKKEQSAENPADEMYLLVGTYTSGSSRGIYVYRFDETTGDADKVSEVETPNPSYLAVSADEQYVYAVNESGSEDDAAVAFRFDKAKGILEQIDNQPTRGKDPCYIALDSEQTFAVTANYSGGNLTVFPIQEDGSLEPATQCFGSVLEDPSLPASHIHTAMFSPDEKYLFVTDLGKDAIYRYDVSPEGRNLGLYLKYDTAFMLEKGSGPRHLAFHPKGKYLYCINELSGKVTVFDYLAGDLKAVQYIAADTTPGEGGKGSADIHLSADGRFLYASNRLQSDGITIFSVNPADGMLTPVAYQATGVHPRNFILSPDGKFLLVAARDSNKIQVFEVNKDNGLLKDTGKDIVLDKPVCLKFIDN